MTPEKIDALFSFLYQGPLSGVVFWLRLIAGVITSAALAFIAVVAIRMRELSATHKKPEPKAAGARAPEPDLIEEPWRQVRARIASTNPADWNLAVIQADAVFDSVLKDMGLAGETMGERLQLLDVAKLNSLNDVWEAHKMRNRIAHETDLALSHEEASRAVSLFEKGLRELAYIPE